MMLLPENKKAVDKKLDELMAEHLALLSFNLSTLTKDCDERVLYYLAKSLDVDIVGLSGQRARDTLGRAFEAHKLGGTLKAVKLAVYGFLPDAMVIEGNFSFKYSGGEAHNGAKKYGFSSHWAEYVVLSNSAVSQKESKALVEHIQRAAPVRCVFKGVIFSAPYNAELKHDGKYNYGVAQWQI